jgi:catechol-2,3-dioxygenase
MISKEFMGRARFDSLRESAGTVGRATPLASEQQAGFRTTRRRYLIIRPERIGHVVIKVRNLERSRKFYTEVLGMDVMMEIPAIHGVFLADHRRDHHEIALFAVGPEAAGLQAKQIGLAHIAFRLRTEAELRAATAD